MLANAAGKLMTHAIEYQHEFALPQAKNVGGMVGLSSCEKQEWPVALFWRQIKPMHRWTGLRVVNPRSAAIF
jgi:hypothetical protein